MIALIGTPFGSLPVRVDGRTLRRGRGEAGVRVRGLRAGLARDLRRPPLALPVDALGRRLVGHAFPPDAAVGSQRDVGEDVLRAIVAIAFGLVLSRRARARRRRIRPPGLIARSRPFASGLIQAMSSPTVVTFQPSNRRRRDQHREIRLAAGAGERGGDVGLLALRDPRRRGSACARPSSLRRAPCSTRCAARSISCRAARCRRSPSRTTRSRASPGNGRCTSRDCTATARLSAPASSGAPTVCMHGHDALVVAGRSPRSTGRPMRAMMRMFTTT